MMNPSLIEKLKEMLSPDRVYTDPEDLICYGYDAAMDEQRPDCVVFH